MVARRAKAGKHFEELNGPHLFIEELNRPSFSLQHGGKDFS
jgi:hypothetical protein